MKAAPQTTSAMRARALGQTHPRHLRSQGGVALLMVLMCLALVSTLLAQMSLDGRRDIERLSLLQAETQAQFYANGAEIIAQRALTDAAVRQASLWWQTLRGRPIDYPTDEGEIKMVIEDMRTCFNLNTLAGRQHDLAFSQLRQLLNDTYPQGIGPLSADTLAARIADWVDADSQARSNSLEGTDYTRQEPPRVTGDTLMADISELNWIAPLDTQRFLQLPQLCVLPETSAWRLNLNSVTLDDLPLMNALFNGEVAQSTLIRLINARPATGYNNLDEVKSALGSDDQWLTEKGGRLTLTPDYIRLHIRLTLGPSTFNFTRLMQAEGVSAWAPKMPAARVRILARHEGDVSAWMTPPQEGSSQKQMRPAKARQEQVPEEKTP
ncbi:general secretion pathway protein GspK [Terasakiispira papahanaumokuakeensis]|uniref:General secretion pathway protein GspK n=1 Tax=Terasakiispira papahanaumokuakeensis TaxID=197479 RepID=A0A1E2VDJ0_9GAMM|nr:type II secretion system minor pseudopilin GspK [Terasakiispira papahanaumokuakeensis]ODC04886.1 general secretion pathway protein GspK [Terasakiispira papahanaumokuakeensis]